MADIFAIWPSLLMGLAVPIGILLVLLFSKNRNQISFISTLYGFGTFVFSFLIVAVLLVVFGEIFLGTITLSSDSDADSYIIIGGSIVLALYYIVSELLKLVSFLTVLKSETPKMAGFPFGCGFILAQNMLIFGLSFFSEVDFEQSLFFGLLMLLSGIVYILLSAIGYQFAKEKQRFVGMAISLVYYLFYAVILIFSNIYITYAFYGAMLLFVLLVAYLVLPHPFKKKKEDE